MPFISRERLLELTLLEASVGIALSKLAERDTSLIHPGTVMPTDLLGSRLKSEVREAIGELKRISQESRNLQSRLDDARLHSGHQVRMIEIAGTRVEAAEQRIKSLCEQINQQSSNIRRIREQHLAEVDRLERANYRLKGELADTRTAKPAEAPKPEKKSTVAQRREAAHIASGLPGDYLKNFEVVLGTLIGA